MEAVDITRMSSRGQIVIPGDIRESLGLEAGMKFVVYGEGDTVVLKLITKPSIEDAEKLLSDSRKFARKTGLRKNDVTTAIRKSRKSR